MFDADDPGTVINEFLVALFVPGILLFVGTWAAARLVYDATLREMGFAPIVPEYGAGLMVSGFSRFVLLIIATSVLLVPYVALYARVLRPPLRRRGLV
jgi:hypothetical protein